MRLKRIITRTIVSVIAAASIGAGIVVPLTAAPGVRADGNVIVLHG